MNTIIVNIKYSSPYLIQRKKNNRTLRNKNKAAAKNGQKRISIDLYGCSETLGWEKGQSC